NKSESFVENNSLTKTGAGTVRLTAANEYTGPTTISGGALALASTGSLVSDVTVEPGASFIDAAPSITSNVTVDRGSFVIGDTTSSAQIVIGDLTVYDGSILFDFNDSSSSTDYDRLTAASMTFTTASINVTFNNGDQTDWWNNNTDNGYVLIDTSSLNGSVDNIQLLVNSAATDAWYLDTVGTSIVLKNQNYEPPVTDLYYRANSSDDISDQKWTIDGANKQGVTFTAGDNNTATFAGEVEMNANGSFEVAENKNLKLTGPVTGEGEVEKKGDGTLTLSGNNTYTGKTTVTDGTLTLTGAAVKTNSPIEIAEDATLEYNVPSGQKSLEFNNVNSAVTGSNAIKTGAGTLKILSTDGLFAPDKFAVEAGELDFQGTYNGDIEVKRGATLSAGNSPGDLTVYGDVKIDAGATGLFEFSAFTADKEQQVFDQMFITGASSFILDPGSTIKLSFLNGDAGAWSSAEDAVYQLVFDENFVSETTDLSEFLETKYQGVFALEGTPEGLFLHGLGVIPVPEPGSGVPEPSTWALLLLGAAGLMYWRKKNA
ncbi:MAG: autotransporter-associated beta strand repeat-containing protein, partial [Thermoguttaceae bacterium]|nr:autotransporter-associated beta strand repeat-containing protein [Thermoguttaceae bacterium]